MGQKTELEKAREYAAIAWNTGSQLHATLAQVHATIALAEAQERIANMMKLSLYQESFSITLMND